MVTTRARSKHHGGDEGLRDEPDERIERDSASSGSGSSLESEQAVEDSEDDGRQSSSASPEQEDDQETEGSVSERDDSLEPASKQAKLEYEDLEPCKAGDRETEVKGSASPGKAEASGASDSPQDNEGSVVESGRVYFFYRPRVGVEHVESLQAVQRFFLLLEPNRSGAKARLIIIGKKRLPAITSHERYFAFVDAVADDKATLVQGMGEQHYETKTMGEREVGAARAVGEGVYSILNHVSGTSFAYRLEVPAKPGEAQKMCGIEQEGSFSLSVKNPQKSSNPGVGLNKPADLPKALEEEFQDYAWIAARDAELLDFERVELLFIGASRDLATELGAAGEEVVAEAKAEGADVQSVESELAAKGIGLVTGPLETGQVE